MELESQNGPKFKDVSLDSQLQTEKLKDSNKYEIEIENLRNQVRELQESNHLINRSLETFRRSELQLIELCQHDSSLELMSGFFPCKFDFK